MRTPKNTIDNPNRVISKYHSVRLVGGEQDAIYRITKKAKLYTVMFTLTYQCNLNCPMCLSKDINKKMLDLPIIKNILDEAARAGALRVIFSGGEVMMRKDFPEIYRYAAEKGFFISVFTNLTLLDDRIMDLFKQYPPEALQVTMYGLSKETYEGITGVEGSFDKFMANLKRIKKEKMRIRYAMTITRSNEKDLDQYFKMLIQPWENKSISFILLGRSDRDGAKMDVIRSQRISPQKAGVLLYDRADYKVVLPAPKVPEQIRKKLFAKCNPNAHFLYLDTNGDCMLCYEFMFQSQKLPYAPGRLKEIAQNLVDIRKDVDFPVEKDTKCIDCPKYAYCKWCPQYAMAMKNDLEYDRYMCRVMDAFYKRGGWNEEAEREKKEVQISAS